MPVFVAFEDEELANLESTGGKKSETIRKRALFINTVERYMNESNAKYSSLVELVKDKEYLEDFLCRFFTAYRVGKDATLPMMNTLLNCRSHLKCEISRLTESQLDIQNKDVFSKFHVSKMVSIKILSVVEVTTFWFWLFWDIAD